MKCSASILAAVVATASLVTSANAGVTFSYQLIGTAGGYDEFELDVASFTGTDSSTAGNGITSVAGTLTAVTGNLFVTGANANARKLNFSNAGTGQGGGSTWINLDSYASSPVLAPSTTTPTSIAGWAMFTTDSSSFLNPTTAPTASTGYPSNVLGEVYITHGSTFSLVGNYNTVVANNVPFVITNAVSSTTAASVTVSLASAGTGTNDGTVIVKTSGPNNYAGQVLVLASAANAGNVAITNVGGTDTGDSGATEVLLFTTGTDNPAQLAAKLAGNVGGATILTAGVDADSNALFAAYTTLGNAAGVGAPTLLLRYTGSTDAGNNFFNFALPAGDTLTAITAVPEPASLGLLAIGALGLMGRRSKK